MKNLSFGQQTGSFEQWAKQCFDEIERASSEDVEAILSAFSVTGTITETRTFNAVTATADDLRNVLATMVSDIRKRGARRSYGST